MAQTNRLSHPPLTCTAFDGVRKLASGSYLAVALAVRDHMRGRAGASVLIFDDATGKEIDFDLRGSDQDVARELQRHFPGVTDDEPRSRGRPKLGVVAREVTLLPRHWEWLGEQPGGASVTLRRLTEEARRAGLNDKAQLRRLQERTYRFMSAMAGDRPGFEEASRALFANDIPRLKALIAAWPTDVGAHVMRLWTEGESVA